MEEYQNKFSDLASRLKQERPKTPIQEVQPVKVSTPKEPEVRFNNWILKGLLKRLKAFGLEHDQSLKDINIRALENFLKSNMKY